MGSWPSATISQGLHSSSHVTVFQLGTQGLGYNVQCSWLSPEVPRLCLGLVGERQPDGLKSGQGWSPHWPVSLCLCDLIQGKGFCNCS